MKKILSFIVLLAGVISFTSCSDDDATYTPVLPLEIASNDVYFEAAGGTGSIVVNATGSVTAETTSDWITLSVNGKTVTVTAKENTAFDGRSARIVLTADGATTNVTAIQKGNVYQVEGSHDYTIEDGASTLKISIVSSSPVTVKSLVDWITATYNSEDSEITINIEANTTTASRVGEVVIEAGSRKDTLTITQGAPGIDVTGDYNMYFMVEDDDESLYYVPATLTSTSLNFTLFQIQETPFSLPVKIDKSIPSITVTAGSYLGTVEYPGLGTLYTYLIFSGMADGIWTGVNLSVSKTATMTAELMEEEGTLYGIFKGEVSDGQDSYVLDGWLFEAFNSRSFTDDADLGYLDQIYNIILEKQDANGARSRGAYRNAKPYKAKSTPYPLRKH